MPIDPALESRIRPTGVELAELVNAGWFDAAESLLFGLRRLALDPSIDNVHHARNAARAALREAESWRREDQELWKQIWGHGA